MEKSRKVPLTKRIDDFIFEWSRFTVDLWWRKKYNVPFGSPQHRAMNFIDMAIDYQESFLVSRIISKEMCEEDEEMEAYIDSQLGMKKSIPMSQEEIDEDYEKINLEKFDE